jgi:hypothetical protein
MQSYIRETYLRKYGPLLVSSDMKSKFNIFISRALDIRKQVY